MVDFCNSMPLFLRVCMVDFCNIRPLLMGVCMGDFCNISLLRFYIPIYIWLTLFINKSYIFPLISLKEKTRENACEWNKWEFSCDISTFISLMVRQNIFQVSDTSSAGLSLRLWLFFRFCDVSFIIVNKLQKKYMCIWFNKELTKFCLVLFEY